jgi:Fe-coproporphyrin III synthase
MNGKLHGSVIVTYRCNARCNMCNVWRSPPDKKEDLPIELLDRLPSMFFVNITGGEPFVRDDMEEIVARLRSKARRIVISSNGFYTGKVLKLFKKYPDLGIRISVEGLQRANDEIRGIPHGFDRTLRTLLTLKEMRVKDIGFGITLQERNAPDALHLYALAEALKFEFATATLHNSHYFRKTDNRIAQPEVVTAELEKLIEKLLRSKRPKNWFRAFFNFGLINYLHGRERFLPCEMGRNGFFLDPEGDVLACNGMDVKMPMGNLKETRWEDIWQSPRADQVRKAVAGCPKQCWMIGSAAPAIWGHPWKPLGWVLRRKLGRPFGLVGR